MKKHLENHPTINRKSTKHAPINIKEWRGQPIGPQQTENHLEGATSKLATQPMFEPMTKSNEKASNMYLSMQIMLKINHTGPHASKYFQRSKKYVSSNNQQVTPKPKQQTYWSR